MIKLLIVDDDVSFRKELQMRFKDQYEIFEAKDLTTAVAILKSNVINIVLLDLMLDNERGETLFKSDVRLPPVIVTSVLSADENILECFGSGAIDYVTKPFNYEILDKRIQLRVGENMRNVLRFDDLAIDRRSRMVTLGDEEIKLTPSEFNILLFLASNPNVCFSSDELFEELWGEPGLSNTSIKKHLSYLRNKLKGKLPSPCKIETVFGRGYVFKSE